MFIKANFSVFVFSAFLVALTTAANAATITIPTTDAPRTIVMTGEAEVKAEPDQAVVSGGAVTQSRTASDAVAANSEIMSRVFDSIQKMGIARKAIATYGFSLEPQYPPRNDKDPQPHTIIGYEVSNGITITLDDVTRAGAVLDALIDAGANQSAGVTFSIRNPQPLLDQARAEAGKDALNRAQIYARSVGAALGPVRSIREGYGGIAASNSIESVVVTARRVATPIEAGQQSITATVTIEWAVK
jgi:uncharacterized protein YggE